MQNFEFGMQRILAQWVPGLIENKFFKKITELGLVYF